MGWDNPSMALFVATIQYEIMSKNTLSCDGRHKKWQKIWSLSKKVVTLHPLFVAPAQSTKFNN